MRGVDGRRRWRNGSGSAIGRRRLLAAALGLVLAGSCLHPATARVGDRLTGYGKLLFGMTTAEIEAITGATAQPRPERDAVVETAEKVAGLPATRTLVLTDGRLASIVFNWVIDKAAAGSPPAPCPGLFSRLLDQITRRYGPPAIGPHPRPGAGAGQALEVGDSEAGFAGTSFWSFPDGASIALIVRGDDPIVSPAGAGGCRATVNYKRPPADDPAASGLPAADAAAQP